MKDKFPMMRVRQFLNNPFFIVFWLKRLFWYKWTSYKYLPKYEKVKQMSANETLADLINNRKSIIRFGDGEFGILSGGGIFQPDSDWSQRYSKDLKETISRQLSLSNPSIVLGVPPMFHLRYREGMVPAVNIISSMHTETRMYLWNYLKSDQVYGDWSVFMPQHHKNMDWALLASYLKDKTVVVVTGGVDKLSNIKLGSKTLFVECGKHDAFGRRDQIVASIDAVISKENLDKNNTLFWVSLGCTAGYMVEHLVAKGFIAWDTGHVFRYAQEQIKKELA